MDESARRLFRLFGQFGIGDDELKVSAIEKFLITPEQTSWLNSLNLGIRDIVEHNYSVSIANAIAIRLYGKWNQKLGFDYFSAPDVDTMITEIHEYQKNRQ